MMENPQEHMVLGFLMKKERHGYEIHHLLSSELGRTWYVGISQVYALLKRLQADEKVLSTIEQQDNRPAKLIYSITAKGRESFLQWVHTPLKKIRDLRLAFLSKLFFILELNLPGSGELIQKQINIFQKHLESIKQENAIHDDAFNHLVSRFRITQIDAVLAWLEEVRGIFNVHDDIHH